MGSFSLIHWIILGIIVLLLFGGNRFSAMMKDVAHGLKSFKQGLSEDEEKNRPADPRQLPPQQNAPPPIDLTAQRPADPVQPPRDDSAR